MTATTPPDDIAQQALKQAAAASEARKAEEAAAAATPTKWGVYIETMAEPKFVSVGYDLDLMVSKLLGKIVRKCTDIGGARYLSLDGTPEGTWAPSTDLSDAMEVFMALPVQIVESPEWKCDLTIVRTKDAFQVGYMDFEGDRWLWSVWGNTLPAAICAAAVNYYYKALS